MSDIKQVGIRLKKHLTQTIEGIPAELGKKESGGSYTVPTGQPNEVYVRLYGDENQTITAINVQTKWQSRLPVLVQLTTSGRYRVVTTDPAKIGTFLGSDASGASIPPVRGASIDALWESYQLNMGRIHALNGSDLQVYMEPLPYGDTDLGSVSGNMTTAVGTITSGKKAWIVVSVDPATNILAFTKGTEYSAPIPLTRAMATTIAVTSGNIKLWAYAMRAGDTYIPVQKRSPDSLYFVDLRPWVQVPIENVSKTATVQTTDATTTTLASIAVAELQAVTITATITAAKDDYSAALGGTLTAVVRRATAGNVTLVGSVTVVSQEDSAGSPSFTLDVDTTSQTARIRVTGISAETWNFKADYKAVAN